MPSTRNVRCRGIRRKSSRMRCCVASTWLDELFSALDTGRAACYFRPASGIDRSASWCRCPRRGAKREVDPCGNLAEAQVGVASTGRLSLLGHLKQRPASAPPSALAATAGKLHRPTPQHVLVEGPAANPGLSRDSLHGWVRWWGWGVRAPSRSPLAKTGEFPVVAQARADGPVARPISADHERRRCRAEVTRAVLASDLYPVRVGW